jgi:hypothetical protein
VSEEKKDPQSDIEKHVSPEPAETKGGDSSSSSDEVIVQEESLTSSGEVTGQVEIEAEVETKADVEITEADAQVTEADAQVTEADAQVTEADAEATEVVETPEGYYKKLAERAEGLLELSDRAQATVEFGDINHLWSEGPDPEGAEISVYRKRIDESRDELERRKKEHYEEQKQRREKNLEKKKELLASLRSIIEEKQWSKSDEVRRIRNRWEKIRAIPSEHVESLEKKFSALLKEFKEHEVERFVEQRQREDDNLLGKVLILSKMKQFLDQLNTEGDWEKLENEFEELSKQFRKIGKVPAEKNQEIWSQYHELQDRFASERFKNDKKYKQKIESALKKKRKLIDEAEALVDFDDLAEAASKVNKLHRKWKKAGNLPQKDENELWDRFKAATDAFNEKKAENIDDLRDQEEENLSKKEQLIEKAVALQDSEEWEKTHHVMQSHMKEWKEIGPVPRKKTGKIWNQFKKAMDHFYDRRRDRFKDAKKERKENLKEKEQIIESLNKLVDHEDPIAAVEEAKPLQEAFKETGYVPIKHKNRLWQEYREACDKIYERFRAARDAEEVVGRENIDKVSTDDISKIRNLKIKLGKLQKEVQRMRQELIQKKESLSYFKPSSSGSSLLDDVKKNISDTEKRIEKKESEIVRLDTQINKLSSGTEEGSSEET